MLQRVCEKCGAVIEKPKRRNFIGYQPWYLKMHFFKTNEQPETETSVDLCNVCRDLFDEWLMEQRGDVDGNER